MRRTGTAVVAVSTLAVALLSSLSTVVGTPAAAASAKSVRAVVLVRPGTSLPLRPAGGRVLEVYRAVDSELVSASPKSLARLTADPQVRGIAPDWRGRVAGHGDRSRDASNGVLAADAVGGDAGQAGVGAGVTVALLDTGVTDTAALSRASGRLIDGVDMTNLGRHNNGTATSPLTDGYGHGTFMASLIAGGRVQGSDGRGLGIAPATHVVVVKVADSRGRTSLAEVLGGLDWVATHSSGIQVVNLSLAVTRPMSPAYGSDPLTAAIGYVRNAGVLPVAAVGNDPGQVGDPGMAPQSLTVGAADLSGHQPSVAKFSGSGVVAGVVKPDVVAPGMHVFGEMAPHSTVADDNPSAWQRDGLFIGSGTSEATAITAGVAAAYLSAHPGASPLAVKAAVRRSAQPMCVSGSGAGLVTLSRSRSSRSRCSSRDDRSGVDVGSDPSGEASFNSASFEQNSWLHGAWKPWMASSWSASSWSASSWSASSWSASSWSASSWSASSWSASSWSAENWGQ
jgi:serine protease AprX